jgi:uncharacterized phage-associated protein
MNEISTPRGAPGTAAGEEYAEGVGLRAHDVAAELRRQFPGLPVKKLHKLLYYCQGHHLVGTGEPLFAESLSAWDMGPVAGSLWKAEQGGTAPEQARPLADAELNTVQYVVTRYGHLSGLDLEHLTQAESPWQRANEARAPKGSSRIRIEWILESFAAAAEEELAEAGIRDRAVVTAWLADAPQRAQAPRSADTVDALRRRLADAG